MFRIHTGRGTLNRIDNVKSSVDKWLHERLNRSAGMFKGLPRGVCVDPIVDLLIVRCVERREGIGRTKLRGLGAKIRSAEEHYMNAVAHHIPDLSQVLEGDLALPRKNRMDVVLTGSGRHIPFCNVPDTPGVLQERRRYQGNVTKGGSTKIGNHTIVFACHLIHLGFEII